ncbi:MAG: hypothetical protein R2708_05175 [Vicinamibacterales bacterium]
MASSAALLDLGRDQLPPAFRRSFESHYTCPAERLLATPLPMVIHVDPTLELWSGGTNPSNTTLDPDTARRPQAHDSFGDMQRIRHDEAWRRRQLARRQPQAAL